MKNKVQLFDHVGDSPKSYTFENSKKISRFTMATNEYFLRDGEKIQNTDWHTIVAWGKQSEFVEKNITKGAEIAIEGKLTSSSYENDAGEKQHIT